MSLQYLTPGSVVDEMLRGVAISAVYRGLVLGKPVLSMATITEGGQYGAASVIYSVVRPTINGAIAQTGISLPEK